MHRGGEARRSLLPWRAVVVATALVATACGDAGPEPAAVPARSRAVVPDAAAATGGPLDRSGTTTATAPAPAAAAAPTTTATTSAPVTSTVVVAPFAAGTDVALPADPIAPDPDPDATTSLEGFGTSPRSAPASAGGTALLRAVRVGRHAGFERIVFEFEGRTQPSYRIRWADGRATADGSGAVVDVAGAARLEVVLSPASGVDLTDGTIVYDGPDRVAVADQVVLIRDLVRTGDFEGVLSWAVGASTDAPFRVLTLSSPTRLVVDLRTASDGRS